MSKGEINHVNSWEVNIEETTPAMQQYLKIKKEHPGILLWYRMGDFFETFFEKTLDKPYSLVYNNIVATGNMAV